jgi:hypothetical protein
MVEQVDTRSLIDEIVRYLAAVDLFRAQGCEPTWRPDVLITVQTISTSAPPRLPSDITLH